MNDEQQIRAVIDEVGAAFTALDFDRWLACFHTPRTVIFPDRVFASSSEADSREALLPIFDAVRKRDFRRTHLDTCNVRLLSTNTAVVSTVWSRYKANDELLEQLGATYQLFRGDAGWKIAVLNGHRADVVLVDSSDSPNQAA